MGVLGVNLVENILPILALEVGPAIPSETLNDMPSRA